MTSMRCKFNRETSTLDIPRGAGLLEVLIAVVVGSVGLLGIAALLATSAKSSRAALEHTLAGLAAQTLTESMHVNPEAVRHGLYDGNYAAFSHAAEADCRKRSCSSAEAAAYDRALFSRMLEAALADPHAQLNCDAAISPNASTRACRLHIHWSQRGLQANENSIPQTLVWVFAP